MDKIIFAHVIINSIGNKFDRLSDMMKGLIHVLPVDTGRKLNVRKTISLCLLG